MTRNEREHLNKLSKEVFGKANAWQKLHKNGEPTKIMSKRRADKGGEMEVTYFQHVPIENIKAILEEKAREIAAQKDLKEKANVGSGQLELGSTPATGTDGGPVGSTAPGAE